MLSSLAVHYLVFYAFCSIFLPLPIVYASYFGHFKGYNSFFDDDDRLTVLFQISLQVFVSVGIAYSAMKCFVHPLRVGLIYLMITTVKDLVDMNWLLFDTFDCNETECMFYGFSLLTYFSTGKLFSLFQLVKD